jgi:GTP-binding protein Era
VASGDGYQLVLVDLPGFQRPSTRSPSACSTVDHSLSDVDAIALVLAADERIGRGDRYVARGRTRPLPVVVVLNKVDRRRRARSPPRSRPPPGSTPALHPVS